MRVTLLRICIGATKCLFCCCFRFHCRMCVCVWQHHSRVIYSQSDSHQPIYKCIKKTQPIIRCGTYCIANMLSNFTALNEMQFQFYAVQPSAYIFGNKEQRNEFSEKYLAGCGYIYYLLVYKQFWLTAREKYDLYWEFWIFLGQIVKIWLTVRHNAFFFFFFWWMNESCEWNHFKHQRPSILNYYLRNSARWCNWHETQ